MNKLVIGLLVLVPALALAKTYPHGDAKVSITIPDSWKVETEENSLTANSPDESVVLLFMVVEATDTDEALKALDKELDKVVKNVKTDGKPEEITVNGMKGVVIDGTGKVDGQKVDLGLLVLSTKSGKVLFGLGFGETGKYKKHEADVEKIFKSIKPL